MAKLAKEDIERMRQDGSMAAADALAREIERIAGLLKLKQETLTDVLYRHSVSRNLKWQADMWKSASPHKAIYEWAFWHAYKNGDGEAQLIDLKERLPALVQKAFTQMAKTLPAPKGGKPTTFDWLEEWQVRARVRAEIERGRSKREAYARVSHWYTSKKRKCVSAHTIRRICEPEERKRTRSQSRYLGAMVIEDA